MPISTRRKGVRDAPTAKTPSTTNDDWQALTMSSVSMLCDEDLMAALDEDLSSEVTWGSASGGTHHQILSPLSALTADAQLGFTSTAFAEMAQWRGPAAHELKDQKHAHLLASPSRASSLGQSLVPGWDLPFIDLDESSTARPVTASTAGTLSARASTTPRTAGGGRSKRRRDQGPEEEEERTNNSNGNGNGAGFALASGSFVVPTPTKASPDGEKRAVVPAGGGSGGATPRSISFTSLTRRISVTTSQGSGRPGSSLGPSAPSPSGRSESPFGRGRRSSSPFITIKPPPASLDTLRSINLMVNRAQTSSRGRASSKGRPGSALSAGRSTAASPAPSARAPTPRPSSATPSITPRVPTPPAVGPTPPPATTTTASSSIELGGAAPNLLRSETVETARVFSPPPVPSSLQSLFALKSEATPGAAGAPRAKGGVVQTFGTFGGFGGSLRSCGASSPATDHGASPPPTAAENEQRCGTKRPLSSTGMGGGGITFTVRASR